jgi:acetyl esterase/lipase
MKTILTLLFFTLIASCFAVREPKQTFDEWDKDKNGKLSLEELPRNARPNFKRADRNHDGSISLDEHEAFVKRSRASRRPPLPESIQAFRNLPYADTDNPRQTLDIFLSKDRKKNEKFPIIVYIHGGGWKNGSKESAIGKLAPYLTTGSFAVAAINYRLSEESIWPSQIHDCKAAIRWLKGNAKKYGLDPLRLAVWGNSAGGHLVAMMGVSGDVESLEGKLGKHLAEDSRVNCVVDFCGPTHLLSMGQFPSKIDHDSPNSPESQLIGGAIQENKQLADNASPITYVTRDDAPILIVHGTDDPLVPFNQAKIFHAALRKAGVKSDFLGMEGMGHGLGGAEVDSRVRKFLESQLLGKK